MFLPGPTEINCLFKYSDLLRQLNFTHDIFILAKDMSAPQLLFHWMGHTFLKMVSLKVYVWLCVNSKNNLRQHENNAAENTLFSWDTPKNQQSQHKRVLLWCPQEAKTQTSQYIHKCFHVCRPYIGLLHLFSWNVTCTAQRAGSTWRVKYILPYFK